jgi:hypothetical protein
VASLYQSNIKTTLVLGTFSWVLFRKKHPNPLGDFLEKVPKPEKLNALREIWILFL